MLNNNQENIEIFQNQKHLIDYCSINLEINKKGIFPKKREKTQKEIDNNEFNSFENKKSLNLLSINLNQSSNIKNICSHKTKAASNQ